MRERCTSVSPRLAVDAELLANQVRDIAGCGGEGTAIGFGTAVFGFDAFCDDPAIPDAFGHNFERLRSAGLEAEMIGNRPRRGERHSITAGQAPRLAGIGESIMGGMQPIVG